MPYRESPPEDLPGTSGVQIVNVQHEQDGPWATEFRFKNCACEGGTVSGPTAMEAAGLQLVIKDLEFAEAALTQAIGNYPFADPAEAATGLYRQEDAQSLVTRSLFVAAVIAYVRPFARTDRKGFRRQEDEVFKGEPDRLQIHREIQDDVRNSYLAHAYESPFEDSAVYLYRSPQHQGFELVTHARYHPFLAKEALQKILEHVQWVKAWALQQCRFRTDALLEALGKIGLPAIAESLSKTGAVEIKEYLRLQGMRRE